jgi:signal transduction histidine kinase
MATARHLRARLWLALALFQSLAAGLTASWAFPQHQDKILVLQALAADLWAVSLGRTLTLSLATPLLAALVLRHQVGLAALVHLLGPGLRWLRLQGRQWPELCAEVAGRSALLLALAWLLEGFPGLPPLMLLLPAGLLGLGLELTARQSLELVPGERRRWRRERRRWWRHELSLWALTPLALSLAGVGVAGLCAWLPLLWLVWRGLVQEASAQSQPSAAPPSDPRAASLSQALERQQSELQLQSRRQSMFWELSHRLTLATHPEQVAQLGLDYLNLRLHFDQAVVLEDNGPLALHPPGSRWLGSLPAESPREGLTGWACDLQNGRRLLGRRRDSLRAEEAVLLQDLAGLMAMAFQSCDRLLASQRLVSSLVHSATIAAVGQLAAGMAHELNSPLAAIQLQLELAGKRCQGEEGVLQPLGAARRSLLVCRELLQKLTYYSRDGSQHRTDLDLNLLVEDSLRLLPGHELWQRQLTSLPSVSGVPGELQQALLHLFNNAREACPQGPWRVSTEARDQRVMVRVEDQGSGLEALVEQRMFEPFFTTRAVGQNRGLGLSVARQIVEQHGGRIGGHNRRPGPGACFWMELPV